MSDVAIRVDQLGKRYRIGALQQRHNTLRDLIASTFTRSHVPTFKRSNAQTFWALKAVSFEVKRGEVVGIIGRNGAGKSTLLKILSRITDPSEGYADLHGRVGSLLEVGTGFHPELTGRENIYLSGAILGMKRAEIVRKFDAIVAFAEVEKFIDTAVKHYSSGMYVRLAFAVAAHLEPDILLVDEVLAVGDAAFQKKCLGKLGDVAQEGRTVLFVSHNMTAIGRLCPRAMWLDAGIMKCTGDSGSVISAYLASADSVLGQCEWTDIHTAPGDEFLRAVSVRILDVDRNPNPILHQDQPFMISLTYRVLKSMMNANVGFELRAADGTVIFSSFDADNPAWSGSGRKPGLYIADCVIPAHLLNEGTYFLTLLAGIPFMKLCIKAEDVLRIQVGLSLIGEGPTGRMGARRAGLIAPELAWQIRFTA